MIFFKKNFILSNIKNYSFKIIGEFKSNGILDSNIAYIPFDFFKENFNAENNINRIELHMSDPFNADKIILNAAKKLRTPVLIYTWMNSFKYIYNDIKKNKAIIYLGLFFLVIISSLGIASISLMTVSKSIKEIAILRSIGASNVLIQLIFLYYGLRSIIISNVIGLLIGIIIILNSERIIFFLGKIFKGNIFFNNIYYNHFFLLQINFLDVIIVFISTMFIGIITNWYPAYYASKINPSKILQKY